MYNAKVPRWVPIDTILNFIPSTITALEGRDILLQWAFQHYRSMYTQPELELAGSVLQLSNHIAELPSDVVKLYSVRYTIQEPQDYGYDLLFTGGIGSDNYIGPFKLEETQQGKLQIQSKLFWNSPYWGQANVLDYRGTNSNLLLDKRFENYWPNCEAGFTIDVCNETITTEYDSGYLLITYGRYLTNDQGDLLIPDDTNLHNALAQASIMRHWENRSSGLEPNAMSMMQYYQRKMDIATLNWKGKERIRNHKPSVHFQNSLGKFLNLVATTNLNYINNY